MMSTIQPERKHATYFLFLLILIAQFASAATYYVSTTGSDSNPGTQAAPFRHLTKGASAATQPGDTVIVMDGTYDNEGVVEPNFVVTLYYSGTPGNPITFKAQNRGKAILDSMNTSTTTTCNGAAAYFNLYNASFIVIQGFVIQRGCDSGIQSNNNAHDILIKWNEIRNIANRTVTDQIGRDGIYINAAEYNFTFDGNTWHDIGRTDGQSLLHFDHAIYAHGQNVTIINNVFYNNNRGFHIQLADGASNWLVANNTFAFGCANGEAGHIMFWGNNSGITLRNNIFYYPNSSALTRYAATVTNSPFDTNIINGAGSIISDTTGFSVGSNQIGPDPKFVNASSAPYDFHAQSGGAGIDTGVNLAGVPVDHDGTARPQGSRTDIGGYEYSGGPSTLSPPVISGIFVSGITTSSAIVNWTTDQPSTSSVQYGLSNYTNTTPTDPTLVTIHSVTLSNLNASTLYHFIAGSTNSSGMGAFSSDNTFTIAASNQPPSAVSVTPSSGSGSSRTFSFVFSDPNGFSDITTAYMLVNSILNWPASCYTYYDRVVNRLWLLNDAATFWMGPLTPGVSGTLQNSQCTLDAGASSVSGFANNLTINVALTFSGAFAGGKNVYMNAVDSGALWSNWRLSGTWTVPAGGNQPPTNVSITPSSASGAAQTFSFVFSDPNGFADMSTAYMLVNSVLNWPSSCYAYYDRAANRLWLLNDTATFWLGPLTPAVAGTAQNSQCSLDGAGSSVSGSANNLTVGLALTFKPAFNGAKNIYMNAVDSGGLWSNWQTRGSWTVAASGNQPPTNVSVTPSSGSGATQTFSFVFSDPNGFADLSTVYMLFNSTLNWPSSCYTYYDRGANALWLLSDAANFWMGPVTPGAATIVQNTQCSLSGAGSSASGSANNLTIGVALTFKAAFSGAKNVYMNAVDTGGLWSNWQMRGTWTAP